MLKGKWMRLLKACIVMTMVVSNITGVSALDTGVEPKVTPDQEFKGFEKADSDEKLEINTNRSSTILITKNTTIVFTNNVTISVTSGNAIQIAEGVTVTLALNGYTVTVNTSGIGMAAIRLPTTSKLIIKEGSNSNGKLDVTGGPGTAPSQGGNGSDGTYTFPNVYAGSGGKGGKGGDAPGAGIGGNGGKGGAETKPTPGGECGIHGSVKGVKGANGNGASGKNDASKSGSIYVFGNVTVDARGGIHIASSLGKSVAGGGQKTGTIAFSGGASGGNGGAAYGAAGIGGGGTGGGSGGAGASGSVNWFGGENTPPLYATGAGGGGGGQTGGLPGQYPAHDKYYGTDAMSGSSGAGGAGGTVEGQTEEGGRGADGGTGGSSVAPYLQEEVVGKLYVSSTSKVFSTQSTNATTSSASCARTDTNMYLLSECTLIIKNPDSLEYKGTAITPTYELVDKEGKTLACKVNTNYGLDLSNNIDAGTNTAKMIFKSQGSIDKGNYLYVDGGTHSYPFSINQNDDPISITKTETLTDKYTYGDSFQAMVNTSAYNKGTISWDSVLDDPYTVSVLNTADKTAEIVPTNVGKLKLRVSIKQTTPNLNKNGIYNFKDLSAILDRDVEITHKDIGDANISIPALNEYLYIGAQIKPIYSVDAGTGVIEYKLNQDTTKTVLKESTDYGLSYGKNLNIDDAGTVTISGTGNYTGSTTKNFTIKPRDINDKDIKVSIVNQTFTGKDLKPTPTITITGNDSSLPKTDYTLSYDSVGSDNMTDEKLDLINVGKKRVKIVGTKNIVGERKNDIDFDVIQADIGDINLAINDAKDVYFDGKEIESRPLIKYNDIILTEDGTDVDETTSIINPNDYEIAFKEHEEAGKATITLTGMKNFKGTKNLFYNVLPRPIYVLPDPDQWKYYGAKDSYGINNDKAEPTYKLFKRPLNSQSTSELKDIDLEKDQVNRQWITNGIPILNYPIKTVGHISRDGADDNANKDKPNTDYAFTNVGSESLKLTEETKRNYEVKLIDKENYYKLKSFLYDGDKIVLDGTIGKNDWYINKAAILRAPSGYNISKSNSLDSSNKWTQELTNVDGDYSKDGVTCFVKIVKPGHPFDGAISSSLVTKYKQDTILPTGNLVMNNNNWSTLNSNSDFDFFLNSNINGLIFGNDELSQVSSKYYFISDKKMGKAELDELTIPRSGSNNTNPIGPTTGIPKDYDGKTWIEETRFCLGIDDYNTKSKMIYVRIEDNAGNVRYINSDGVVFDKDAPILKAEYTQNNQWTIRDDVKITGTVYDETSGLKERYVAYQVDDGALQIIDTKGDKDGNFSINSLKDGDYNLVISAWDKANNQAAPMSFKVKKDTQMPRIIVEGDTASIATSQDIRFIPNVGASLVAKLEVSYNGGAWTTVAEGVDTPYVAKKNGTYAFRITNGAGVVSKETSITFTKIDFEKPKINLLVTNASDKKINENDYTNSQLRVFFNNQTKNLGDAKFEWKLDSGKWAVVNHNLDNEAELKLLGAEGKHTLSLRITAANGEMDEKEFSYFVDLTSPGPLNITVDKAKPNLIKAILNFIFTNEQQVVTMSASDSGSGIDTIQYYVVKGKETLKTLPVEPKAIEKLVNGRWNTGASVEVDKGSEYVVFYKVLDKAGNIAYSRSDRIVIDEASPEIEITYEKAGQWDNNPKIGVYVWDQNPGVESVKYTIDGGNEINIGESTTMTNLNLLNGEHTINVIAYDKSRNKSEKSIPVKVDTGEPSISAAIDSQTATEALIKVDASYGGVSGLSKIMLSKNNQEYIDVTDEIKTFSKYRALENGVYTFRAITGAGKTAEASVTINGFAASSSDLKAVVSAKTADGKDYISGSWTNQDVEVNFSNQVANLDGLLYQLKIDDGSWQNVNAINGYITIPHSTEGIHQYEFKTILASDLKESESIQFVVKIDKTVPVSSMEIGESVWNGTNPFGSEFKFDTYFKKAKTATLRGEDGLSGVEHMESFVIKEADIPQSIKGINVASQIEELGKGRWVKSTMTEMNPNDTYVVFGKVYDYSGNISYVCSDGVVFDDINPTLKSNIDQSNWYRENDTLITFDTHDNLSDVKEVTYDVNNGNKTTLTTFDYGSFNLKTDIFEEGINQLNISVKDKAGNEEITSFATKKDTKDPTISVKDTTIDPSKLVTKSVVEITTTKGSSDIKRVEVKTPDAGEWTDITDRYTKGFIAEEKGTYWFRVVSESGRSAVQNLTLNNISKDIPVVTYIMTDANGKNYLEGEWRKENVKVQFSNENTNQIVSKYMYRIDDGAYQELNEERDNSAIFESREGSHTYTMKLILANGLVSEEVKVRMNIDQIAPQIIINSSVDEWVKENQELEVEVIDDESGLDSEGYSFDNGYTWQTENTATIRANKMVGIYAKDHVDNVSKEKVLVNKIDSQGPTVEAFKQVGNQETKIRDLEASINDYKDLTRQLGSGIEDVYVMTSYPYKDGIFEPNPDKTFGMMNKNGVWVTEKAVSVPYNGTNDVWLVTEDAVGNMNIYSTVVENMIGSGDDEGKTERPDPEHPTPGNPDGGKDKPTGGNGNSQGNGGVIINTPENGVIRKEVTLYVNGNQVSNQVANGYDASKNDIKALESMKQSLESELEDAKVVKKSWGDYIYLIPWFLVLIAIVWMIYLRRKYHKIKKTYQDELEDIEVGKEL